MQVSFYESKIIKGTSFLLILWARSQFFPGIFADFLDILIGAYLFENLFNVLLKSLIHSFDYTIPLKGL